MRRNYEPGCTEPEIPVTVDKNGRLHSYNDEPSRVWTDDRGTTHKEWSWHGQPHRDGGLPSQEVTNSDGTVQYQEYSVHGNLHRDGGKPARVWGNPDNPDRGEHYDHGALTGVNNPGHVELIGRDDMQPIRPLQPPTYSARKSLRTGKTETVTVDINRQLHSYNDKPAQVETDDDGTVTRKWYRHGKPHRDGGQPALETAGPDGQVRYREYAVHGNLHRDGGQPARVWGPNPDRPIQAEVYDHGHLLDD